MLPAEIATESQKSKTECIIGFGDLYVASIQNTHRHTFIPYLFEYKSHFFIPENQSKNRGATYI